MYNTGTLPIELTLQVSYMNFPSGYVGVEDKLLLAVNVSGNGTYVVYMHERRSMHI